MNILVVGCGVVGLTTAVRLQEAGFGVRVHANALPFDSTSIVAAAVWYPYKAYPEDRVLEWGRKSFEVFKELEKDPVTGIDMREGIELLHEPAPAPWWQSAVPGVRQCAEEELPSGYRDGYAFTAPAVEMPIYLRYLMERFRAGRGRVEQRYVSSLQDAIDEGADVVVNCTGLGARELVPDESMVPIRGQVVRVSNPGLGTFLLDEENPDGVTYIVPRSSDCILGGTAEEGRWDTEPEPEVAEGILGRCAKLEPRLEGAEVLEHKVGLRPGRPEIRLKRDDGYGDTPVVHNYGHGGSGVTLSWGCAEEVLHLIQQASR